LTDSLEIIARYDDGSTIRRDRDSLAINADAGLAAAALDASPSTASERAVLEAVLEERLVHESFWLFRAEPIARFAGSGDRAAAESLERRVATFDDAVRTGELGDPRESARRRIIHAEVRVRGLLTEPLLERKAEVLDELGCTHLAAMARGAHALARYYASPERARAMLGPPPERIDAGALSLDWARTVTKAPPNATLAAWWAFCEATFSEHPCAGARGWIIVSQGPIRVDLRWRLENGEHHALYDVSVVDRRQQGAPTT
jgi:hypothetical protein